MPHRSSPEGRLKDWEVQTIPYLEPFSAFTVRPTMLSPLIRPLPAVLLLTLSACSDESGKPAGTGGSSAAAGTGGAASGSGGAVTGAGGQSMIVWLADQSRHRAARVDPRHQRWTVRSAAMAFRCVIGAQVKRQGRDASTRMIFQARSKAMKPTARKAAPRRTTSADKPPPAGAHATHGTKRARQSAYTSACRPNSRAGGRSRTPRAPRAESNAPRRRGRARSRRLARGRISTTHRRS